MPYVVSIDETDGIVIVSVRVFGLAAHEDQFTARDEAFRVCKERHCSRLLVDLSELNTAPSNLMDCYNFGKSLAEAPFGLRIAHIYPIDIKSREHVMFTALVAANLGVNGKHFEKRDEARAWLSVVRTAGLTSDDTDGTDGSTADLHG